MARPFKTGLDYFPLDVVPDDKIEILEAEHGIKGFGVLIKLYQKVYACNYWIKWDKKSNIVFSNRINVNINEVNDIINSCIEWEIFSKQLYDKYSILTSNGIQKRFFEIIKRRKKAELIKEYILIDYENILNGSNIIVNINSINDNDSTQSKVKKKESKRKVPTYSNEFESSWDIYPKRNGTKQGKKPASILFEKLGLDEKRKCYIGIKNYVPFCDKSEQPAMDFERFIRNEFYNDYQIKVIDDNKKEESPTMTAIPGAIRV